MTTTLLALCCECGTLRTFNANWHGTLRYARGEWPDGAPDPTGRLRELQAQGIWRDSEPWWRCMIELKCATCGQRTGHAYIREDASSDWAEQRDHGRR